ncbi:hypothetical protein KOI35_30165 [Actinoplanes bogorensis]|uniref:Uncharacterized protein n=1 Tax=Paractinoplanes bogorensis TaxID=1610840 RepID=A0ABS5Z067_9ACTN|nr:hypothetical protein [Actinoplanes bogorensis]MBU2667785.1 hypothetical protein [Actinoplanes bogorensis]
MKLDLGSVPAWLTVGSILLALRIFFRDRAAADRKQVDAVAIWWEIERDFKPPWEARVEQIKLRMCVRNGSDLPVELTYVSPVIATRWTVPVEDPRPDAPGVWDVVSGENRPDRFFGPVDLPPQKTIEFDWQEVNVVHLAPQDATQLDPSPDAVRCSLRWALVRDNAGRRWQTRHAAGRRAKRIRWWSRHDPAFPYDWKNPIVRRFWEARNRIRAALPAPKRG